MITVITCVKEDTEDLWKTYESIKDLLCNKIHWIVKLSQYCSNNFYDKLTFHPNIIVEQANDVSIYDAINQALKVCSSEFYLVLGAGDRLIEGAFKQAIDNIQLNKNMDSFFYACVMQSHNSKLFLPKPGEISQSMSCPHPGAILKTLFSKEIGYYSNKYEIAADYEHLSKYLQKYSHVYSSELAISEFMGGGMSEHRYLEGALEEELIRIRLFKSNEYAVQARVLHRFITPVANLLLSNFK